MSDASVAAALRSEARLVLVEAPAGCGKTFQGASYAKEAAEALGHARVLILAHTHAACDVFSIRTRGCSGKVEISTIDSLICSIANAYHSSLGLPPDCGIWARKQERGRGYALLAKKVNVLVERSPVVLAALARRYPIVICDEHQDATSDQHSLIAACLNAGSKLRVFGDPMQAIYSTKKEEILASRNRWAAIKNEAHSFEELDTPHRWKPAAEPLGQWILNARKTLLDGGQVDLSNGLPKEVSLIVAENQSKNPRGYSLSGSAAKQVYALVNRANTVLILTPHNDTVQALRSFFNRSIPIWEGHVRDGLGALTDSVTEHYGNPLEVGLAFCTFLESVAVGCSPSAMGNAIREEIQSGCSKRRNGKPAAIQSLARIILDQPDHLGVGRSLKRLYELAKTDSAFNGVAIDHSREFWDAVRLGEFDTAEQGLSELARRRSSVRPSLPPKAISTIHKAKGLEFGNVLIMPCDQKHFADTHGARFKLYVAMSRAMSTLTFVVSQTSPSPLIKL